MQKEITIGIAQKLTSPNPFALLAVERPEGGTNVMAVSWWTYASNHPAMIAVCLSKKGYSGGCIQRAGGFTLSVVGESLRDQAFRCGTCSGRDVDKAALLSLPLIPVADFPAPCIAGSRVNFACRLLGGHEAGDHVMYFGEVTKVLGDTSVKALYAMDGYSRLDTVGD